MTGRETFASWVDYHATVLAVRGEADIRTMLAWEPLFRQAGYAVAELTAATDWLATHEPPRFFADHLPALVRFVRGRRALRASDAPEQYAACVKCAGSGRLAVPLLRSVVGGEWRPYDAGAGACYYEQAVRCDCARGRFGAFTNRDGEPLPSLEDYSRANPSWPAQLSRRRRERLAFAGHDGLPRDLEALRQRLSLHFREPGCDDGP